MAREFSVIVGIDAGRARRGAREFRAASNTVTRGSRQMDRSLKGANRRAVALITTLGRLRGVATVAFSGFLGVGGITTVIRTLSQFQTEMSRVTALVSAQSPTSLQGAMAGLTDKARELGATTLFTATQAAEGMRFLTLAGFEADQVYSAIEPTLNLAAAGMLDLGNAADITSNIMAAFSIDASETEDVVDALAFTAARTNTNIQQLGEAMKFVGPVAGTLGINVEDTAVALGILGNSGLQASLAGTSLRRVMSGLLNPSKEAEKVFADLGLTQEQLVTTMQGENGIVNLVHMLARAGIDAADAFTLFGQRGAPGLLSLVNQRDKLAELTEEQRKAGEVAREVARIMADNIGGDARIALSALQEAILRLGDAGLNDWLRDAVQGFTGFIRAVSGVKTPTDEITTAMSKGIAIGEKFRENWDKIKQVLTVLTAVVFRRLIYAMTVGLVGGLVKVGIGVVTLTAQFIGMGASMATARVAAVGLLTALGPFGALFAAIGVAASYLFYEAYQDGSEATEDLTEKTAALRAESDKLVFTFDKVGESRKKLAIVKLAESIQADAAELRELQRDLDSITPKYFQLTSAQMELARQEQAVREAREAGNPAYAQLASNLELQRMLVQGLQADYENLNEVELKAKIEELNERIQQGESDLIGMKLVLDGTYTSLKQFREGVNDAKDATQEFVDEFQRLTGLSSAEALSFKELIEEANPAAKAIEEVNEKLEIFEKVAALSDAQLKALNVTKQDLAKVEKLLAYEMEQATNKLNDQEKAAKKVAEEAQKIIDRLYPAKTLTREYYREAEQLTAEMIRQGKGMEEVREALLRLRAEYDKNIKKLEETCEKNKEVRECTDDSTKRIQQLWEQAMRNIQDAFADFFRNGLSDFDNFADSLLDAFKDMIANMLAAWFTSGLMNIFQGNAFGAGGNSFPLGSIFGMGGSTPGGTGGTGGFNLGGLGAGFKAFMGAASNFLGGAGAFLSGNATSASLFQFSTPAAGLGGVAAGAGLGALTGMGVDALLGGRGKNNDILSTVGGAIGSIFGPIGSIIGGALGSFASNLFGGAKKLESAVLEFSASSDGFIGTLEKVTSKQKSFFRGRRFSTSREDIDVSAFNEAFDQVVGAITMIGEQLGVDVSAALENFSFEREINVKGKSEEEIQSLLEETFNDAITDVLSTFVDNAEGLSDRLVKTVNLFTGSAEEFIAAFEAAAAIDLALAIDPVTAVQDAIAESSKSLTTSYGELLESYRTLVSEYDGSLESLQMLSQATVILRQAQVELAAALIQAGEAISATFQGSAQSIREQLMSEEELYALRRSQIDDLVAQAMNTTDPAELSRLADEINRLSLDAFNILDEDQKAALGDEFITFFEGLDELFGGQIDEGLTNISEDASAIDQEVATAMTDAAQSIIDANNEARRLYEEWRQWFRDNRYSSNNSREMQP